MPVDTTKPVTEEDMINIASCNVEEFSAYMGKQFGAIQFSQGFEVVKANQELIYVDDGEEQMVAKLSAIFRDED